MSDKDTVTKEFMRDTKIFADAFNYLLYNGKEVIKPHNLHPLDTDLTALPFREADVVPVQRYRDLLNRTTIMQDGKATYLLLGIENQSEVHYAMPVRNMVYDALQYAAQVEQTAKMHREERKRRREQAKEKSSAPEQNPAPKISSGEYLSGFYKDDKLLPVITLVLLFDSNPWDGPLSLHEMMDLPSETLRSYVPDYRIHLIAPESMNT